MQLCDRCPLAGGCCLDYLGVACRNYRLREAPWVSPTNAERMCYGMDYEEMASFLVQGLRFNGEAPDRETVIKWLRTEEPEKL